jgi:hypothetical protein
MLFIISYHLSSYFQTLIFNLGFNPISSFFILLLLLLLLLLFNAQT